MQTERCAPGRQVQRMNRTESRKLHPDDESFKFFLEVDDHHNTDEGIQQYPRHGWACLWRHDPDEPVCDANPYPEVYVQEHTFTYDEYVDTDDSDLFSFPIASPGVLYPHQVDDRAGWEDGPSRLWDFIEEVRDEYYEHGVEPSDLPVRVVTSRMEDTYPDSPYDEVCEIYFRDRANETEYLMWNSNELYGPDGAVNSELIQKILTAFGNAYEEPGVFIEKWGWRQVQINDIESL